MKTYEELMEIAAPQVVDHQDISGVPVHPGMVMATRMMANLIGMDPTILPADALVMVLAGLTQFAKLSLISDDEVRQALATAIRMRDTLNERSETAARQRNQALS